MQPFPPYLLAKETHKASPNSRGREIDFALYGKSNIYTSRDVDKGEEELGPFLPPIYHSNHTCCMHLVDI